MSKGRTQAILKMPGVFELKWVGAARRHPQEGPTLVPPAAQGTRSPFLSPISAR